VATCWTRYDVTTSPAVRYPRGSGSRGGEQAAQLGPGRGRAGARGAQPLADGLQQRGRPGGQLDLDLTPALFGGVLRPPGHRVVGDLGEHLAVRAAQRHDRTACLQGGDRDEGPAAGVGGDQRGEPVRDVVPGRLAQLVPRVAPGRELEVPAVVEAARTPAQRDPVGGQPQVGRVEVAGGQEVRDGLSRLGETAQVGEGRVRLDVVLVLDLQVADHLTPLAPYIRSNG
jgi:hypothetical protein